MLVSLILRSVPACEWKDMPRKIAKLTQLACRHVLAGVSDSDNRVQFQRTWYEWVKSHYWFLHHVVIVCQEMRKGRSVFSVLRERCTSHRVQTLFTFNVLCLLKWLIVSVENWRAEEHCSLEYTKANTNEDMRIPLGRKLLWTWREEQAWRENVYSNVDSCHLFANVPALSLQPTTLDVSHTTTMAIEKSLYKLLLRGEHLPTRKRVSWRPYTVWIVGISSGFYIESWPIGRSIKELLKCRWTPAVLLCNRWCCLVKKPRQ